MRIASLDIGTNTCNISICDYVNGNTDFIFRDKKVVALIDENFVNNTISDEAIKRLVKVLNECKIIINEYKCDSIIACATSGIREAANKDQIIDIAYSNTGIKINVIDGNKEAELVWQAVKFAVPIEENPVIIIDIGGGSIEFCIADNKNLINKYSYKIGIARLLRTFNYNDPLTPEDINSIRAVVTNTIYEFFEEARKFNPEILIGASGSFETFSNLVKYECDECFIFEGSRFNLIPLDYFLSVYQKLVSYDLIQRKNMPGMEIMRVKMMPIAAVITMLVIEKLKISKLFQSNFSIKEGIILDFIEGFKV
ncbi:MAG: hypothetical protein WHW07_05460 [Bacteroidales bacterium]|jgi:exopolyphosphatase/guanosine-5'-triphosphate,3'-diphosphate pyrophosphatase|nr:hypothetical protein [Bacteroidales bacterium]HOL98353.1 hypothetical protein [Bacteroidales bacterium]HOM35709.1 hypothetical protein [Bacteroidales bacterium]HPD23151.1 hypothetical protein [Bacteroidales bacterium]HRS99080.1 hypothetical protein [Bacteroidales bacterium]